MTLKTIKQLVQERKSSLRFLDPDSAMPILAATGYRLIIDVRQPSEFSTKKVKQGIINIPRGILEMKVTDHTTDPDIPIYLDGSGGDRATLAAAELEDMGFRNINVLDFDCDDVVPDLSQCAPLAGC